MANTCLHSVKLYCNQNPSGKEINIERLYYCIDCNQWFSFWETKL